MPRPRAVLGARVARRRFLRAEAVAAGRVPLDRRELAAQFYGTAAEEVGVLFELGGRGVLGPDRCEQEQFGQQHFFLGWLHYGHFGSAPFQELTRRSHLSLVALVLIY